MAVRSTNRLLGMMILLLCLTGPARAEHVTIVATVNDDVITSTDVNDRRALLMSGANIPDTEENRQRITPRVVQSLIDESLQLQEAKKQSITITDADVDKAMDTIATSKNQPAGSIKKSLEAKRLSVRSLQNQVRAQLAWNKVVQRKLRRNVTISKDELIRAQQAQAADPGTNEEQLMALVLPITGPDKVAHVQSVANDVGAALKAGQAMSTLTIKYAKENIQLSAPTWVNEENLPTEVIQAVHPLKTGETSGAVHVGNTVQFIKLMAKRTTKKPAASTQVMIKQISFDLPVKPSKELLAQVAASEQALRQNPGSCEDMTLPKIPLAPDVKFARLTMGDLSADQRSIIARLGVGELSEPLVAPRKVRLVMLCERMEGIGNTVDTETTRQQLFTEKLELEAQKHLRNLRRDASIDIRTDK